jgi:hypothetical protein
MFCTSDSCADVNFSGYAKNYSIYQEKIDNELFQFDDLFSTQTSSRLLLDGFDEKFTWQLHYEIGLETNSHRQALDDQLFNSNRQSYRLTDIERTIGPKNEKNRVVQNLDRINMQFNVGNGDLTIGRQAITFGAARAINPTDVFLPFDVTALNTEYRIGIDAIRYQKPLGQLSEIDVGVVFGEDGKAENSAAFLQYQTNVSGSDYQVTAIRFAEQNLLGFGIQSSVGDFGTWLEFAAVQGDVDYNRASIGTDYAISENLFFMVEYHYNGAGSEDTADYIFEQFTKPYEAGGVFLLGQDYLIPSLSWQKSALTTVSLQTLVNLNDQSAFTSLSIDRSISENFYMGLSIYLFTGDDISQDIVGLPALNSEYGASPSQIFLNFRYYF